MGPWRVRGEGQGHADVCQCDGLQRFVDDRGRARGMQRGGIACALVIAHQEAGGILEVGDQVGQVRPRLPQCGLDAVQVPAFLA